MIFSQLILAKQAFDDRVSQITKSGGGQYDTVFRPVITEGFEPQKPVEIMADSEGYTLRDSTPIGFSDVDLHIAVGVLCSRRIVGDALPIDQASMQVLADIEKAVMADVTQSGTCINTRMGDAEVRDTLNDGYYGWVISFYLHVRARQDDPFQSQ
jgi:hypothetical protein